MRSTVFRRRWRRLCCSFYSARCLVTRVCLEGWIIVAAGNPPEYNKSVREFDVVTLDRIKRIDVEANFDVWKEYAYQVGIHPAVLSYLELRKENFYRMENTVDGKMFVTARGWEDLSSCSRSMRSLVKGGTVRLCISISSIGKRRRILTNYRR